MLKIRLQKIGKKNDPSYRVVLVEHTTSPHGKFIEILGSYNSKLKQKKLNKERIEYWLIKGAQASPTIHNLLVDEKIINKEKVKAWKPKRHKEEVPPAGGIPTEVGKESKSEVPVAEVPKTEEVPKEEKKEAAPTEVGKEPKPEEIKPEAPIDTEPKKE